MPPRKGKAKRKKPRRKKLVKGAVSIERQIGLHRQKLEQAREEGNIGLADYYEKEIEGMLLALGKKRKRLNK